MKKSQFRGRYLFFLQEGQSVSPTLGLNLTNWESGFMWEFTHAEFDILFDYWGVKPQLWPTTSLSVTLVSSLSVYLLSGWLRPQLPDVSDLCVVFFLVKTWTQRELSHTEVDSVQRVFTRVARPLSPADASASAAVRDGAAWFPFTCPRLVERKQVSVFSVSATAGVSNS